MAKESITYMGMLNKAVDSYQALPESLTSYEKKAATIIGTQLLTEFVRIASRHLPEPELPASEDIDDYHELIAHDVEHRRVSFKNGFELSVWVFQRFNVCIAYYHRPEEKLIYD